MNTAQVKNICGQAAVILAAVFIIFGASGRAWANGGDDRFFWGRVVSVQDGDTLTLVRNNLELDIVVVRLYGIDAPESNQPFGKQSGAALRRLINRKIVQVEIMQKADRYGRVVGIVKVNGNDVSLDLLHQGLAWVYPQYCRRDKPCRRYWAIARKARKGKVGLWNTSKSIAPWKWRTGDQP